MKICTSSSSGAVPRSRRGRAVAFTAALALTFQLLAGAQLPGRELLNSERIATEFGSYGIEVVANDGRTRVSNLFSTEAGGARVCRTFAVVSYPRDVDPRVAKEHAAIVAGGSIGAVFADAGWTVRKTHLHFGVVAAPRELADLMSVPAGASLAQHAYVLDVVNDDATIEYAAIVEIHHPDYLDEHELEEIYGAARVGERSTLLATLLSTAAARAGL